VKPRYNLALTYIRDTYLAFPVAPLGIVSSVLYANRFTPYYSRHPYSCHVSPGKRSRPRIESTLALKEAILRIPQGKLPSILRTEPITRLLLLFTPNPIRISKIALYGLSIDEEFKQARISILPSTISLPSLVFHTYTIVDTRCEGQLFINLE